MNKLTKALFTFTGNVSFKLQLVFFVALLVLVSACTDSMLKDEDISNDLSLLSQNLSKEFGKLGVSDAANGGAVDEFYFLVPTVAKSPKFYKDFHPSLDPIVEISDDLAFKNYHAVFNREGAADGRVVVNKQQENYFVDWNPSQTKAQTGKIYRIRVRVGEKVLGHLDVGIVPSSQTKALQDGLIPVVQNQNFRIAFRVEEKECPARIEVKPTEATVLVGGERQYEAIVYNFFGEVLTDLAFLDIKWSVEDGEIASIDQKGMAKGKKFGVSGIKAKSFDVEGTATLFVQEAIGPRPGRDVVVFNDINLFDNTALRNDNNKLFVRNLINFETIGDRKDGKTVWFDCGRRSGYPGACSSVDVLTQLQNIIKDNGFDLKFIQSENADDSPLRNIDADVKILFLWLPKVQYSVAEINEMKDFANEGGRIVFIGEWDGFYTQVGLNVENQFLVNMGAVMRNLGNRFNCLSFAGQPYPILQSTSLRSHPITRDLTNLTIACASKIELGPGDFALFYDTSNTHVLGGVAQIDTNPITELKNARIADMIMSRIQEELDVKKTAGN
jgi:hypothetical protein